MLAFSKINRCFNAKKNFCSNPYFKIINVFKNNMLAYVKVPGAMGWGSPRAGLTWPGAGTGRGVEVPAR